MTEVDAIVLGLLGLQQWEATRLTRAMVRAAEGEERHSDASVSVVVSIRNAGAQWQPWWAAMKAQEWPSDAEIIVVDDGSADETPTLIDAATRDAAPFRLVTLRAENTAPGKRDALALGVARAKGDWLVFTDIDCLPASGSWAKALIGSARGSDAVLGVSWPRQQSARAGGLLHAVQELDAMHIARSYVGWAERGKPYMGVGRNMAVKRSVFPGYSDEHALASGDDDMLIQTLAARPEIRIAATATRGTQMDTTLPPTWSQWRAQKRRHWTTAPHYTRGDQWRLGRPKVYALGLVIAAIVGVVLHNSLWITGGALGCAWLGELLNFRSITKACQTPKSWRNRGGLLPLWSVWNNWVALTLLFKRQARDQW